MTPISQLEREALQSYAPRNYEKLLGMPGFSEKLLKNHFKLYEGYVKNTNEFFQNLDAMLREGKHDSPAYREIKRRLGWEFNGMRLHEYYFENLGGQAPLNPQSKLMELLTLQYGSFDNWRKDFLATGAMRGIGWAALYQDPNTGRLINFWVEEHNVSHLAGGNLILIMDVFEHAFMVDYGTDKTGYMDAFMKNLNWNEAEERLENV